MNSKINYIRKEFRFLKQLDSKEDFENSKIVILNRFDLIPISKHNYKNSNLNTNDYFNDLNSISYILEGEGENYLFNLELLPGEKINISSVHSLDRSIINELILFFYSIYLIEIVYNNKSFPTHKPGENLILTAGPSISQREKVYVDDAVINGWNNEWSKYLNTFEKEFADYIGVKYAMATSSCTGAMHIALMSLGLGEGDEVIVPDITWVATANAVMFVGATPVFADINEDTWDISAQSIEALINDRTKAIMPVHLYGNPCKMDEIMALAEKYELYVIEDAAPSIGAEFNGKKTGSFGNFSAFSFQGAKLAVTGEGGMLCTNDDELYKKAYRIWDQGRIPGSFWIEELGVKYKMSNIQAALGLGQLRRNDLMVEAKRRINKWYEKRLSDVKGIDFWKERDNSKSIYWMTCIKLNDEANISREEFLKKLKEVNVDTRPVFPSISQYPYWPKKHKAQPVAQDVSISAINLPSGVCLQESDIDYVCEKIIEILEQNS